MMYGQTARPSDRDGPKSDRLLPAGEDAAKLSAHIGDTEEELRPKRQGVGHVR